MQVNHQNLKWAVRMISIILVVVVADVLVAMFVHRPLPWVAIIPALIPLLATAFVLVPMIGAEKN